MVISLFLVVTFLSGDIHTCIYTDMHRYIDVCIHTLTGPLVFSLSWENAKF